MNDLAGVDCSTAREALSALLDEEDPGTDLRRLRQHLAGCPACRSWQARAADLTRQARLYVVEEPGPDRTEQILGDVRLPRRGGWRLPVRVAVVVVALAQIGIGLSSLSGPLGLATMVSSTHMDHEQAAFNLAFAVALLLAGCRPRTTRPQLPVLGCFVVVLTCASAFDLVHGHAGWSRLATHIPIVVGLLLCTALASGTPTGPTPAADTKRASTMFGPHRDTPGHLIEDDPASEDDRPPPAAYRDSA